WVKYVATLKPEEQIAAVRDKLSALNPRLRDMEATRGDGGAVTYVRLVGADDLTPLRAFPHLTQIGCMGVALKDLQPLAGLPLKMAAFTSTAVTDLSPLRGAPLGAVSLDGNPVQDLSPLAGAPLKFLQITDTSVADLAPLEDCPLEKLSCNRSR